MKTINRTTTALSTFLAIFMLTGCAMTGASDQLETTVIDTHRRIVRLDNNLEDSVEKLNTTTAELIARLNETDTQMRRLTSLVEENQVKLDRLLSDLNELKATVYRQWNLTGGAGYAPPVDSVDSRPGEVVIERPGTPTVTPPPQQPARTIPPDDAAAADEPATPTPSGYGDPAVQYQQAQRSYANEEYAQALQQFEAFLTRYPDSEFSANAQFWKAKCLLNLGRYQDSISEFEKVPARFPQSTKVPFALHNQAVAHSRLGQADAAIALLEKVIDQYPVSPAADQAISDLQTLKGN